MKYIKFKDRVLISGMLKDGISIRDISELTGYSQNTILYEINGAKSKDQYDPLRKQLLKKYSQSLRYHVCRKQKYLQLQRTRIQLMSMTLLMIQEEPEELATFWLPSRIRKCIL